MSESNKERPILIIHDDKITDNQWILAQDSAVIGRGEECDIVLPERQISRQHVRIFKEDDAYYVEDLESRNGTWINGQQLKGTRRLYDGDKIDLALAVHLEFIGSGATAPLAFQVPVNLSGGRLRLDRDARRVFINDSRDRSAAQPAAVSPAGTALQQRRANLHPRRRDRNRLARCHRRRRQRTGD